MFGGQNAAAMTSRSKERSSAAVAQTQPASRTRLVPAPTRPRAGRATSIVAFIRHPSTLFQPVSLPNLVVAQRFVLRSARGSLFACRPEHGHDIFDRDNEEQVVRFKIDRNSVLRMKQDLIVFTDREIL